MSPKLFTKRLLKRIGTLIRGLFYEEIVSFFLNGFDIADLTPEYIDLMIENGADINEKDYLGRSVFMHTAAGSSNFEILDHLIHSGAIVNDPDDAGITPLMMVSRYNSNPKILEYLVHKGADINQADSKGRTALMYAAIYTHNPGIVEKLFELGADVHIEDNRGLTAFDHFKRSSNPWLKGTEAINLLRQIYEEEHK
ncbi:MAG: ankyrin repeat domain-containing protein [Candidatus Cloacimonadia bacterium]|jgi:ankyrin repeat protein